MRALKKTTLFLLSTVLAFSFTACNGNGNGGDNAPPAEIQYPVGAEMSYRNGTVGRESTDYNSDIFYYNELRIEAPDPHVIYSSNQEVADMYRQFARTYQYQEDGEWKWIEGWSEERFEQEYGTLSQRQESFGDKFFMTCSRGFTPSEQAGEQFDCTYAAFRIFSSDDLVDWSMCGAIEGAGLAANINTEWWSDYQWAPEFYRDPTTGLYFLFYSMSAKWGSDNGLIPNVFGALNDSTVTNMQLSCAIATSPVGPYKLITTESYYAIRCAKNAKGEIITGSELIESPDFDGDGAPDATYREIYDRDGVTVIAYKSDDGKYYTRYGYEITKNTPPFNVGYYYPRLVSDEGMAKAFVEQAHVTTYSGFENSTIDNCVFTAIDAHMYTDPVSGDTYMYFSRTTDEDRKYSYVGSIWGVKMKDPITPDWDTFTPLVYPGKTTIYHASGKPFGVLGDDGEREGSVNEGPAMTYHNGKYYMTYSPWGAGSDDYSVQVAVSDSPLGEFVKPGPDYTPVLGRGGENNDYMAGTGHHCFITLDGELYAVYHAQKCASNNHDFISGGFMERAIAFDRITFKYVPDLGYDAMFGNGPSYNLQPKPKAISGYDNVAKYATVTGNGTFGSTEYVNDGLITAHVNSRDWEYGCVSGDLKITLKWQTPVNVKAVMVYNSGDFAYAFNQVEYIQFKLTRKPAWYGNSKYNGYVYVKNVKINEADVRPAVDVMVKGGSAIAEFNEITITEMTLCIKATEDNNVSGWQSEVHLSEIYVLGQGGNA